LPNGSRPIYCHPLLGLIRVERVRTFFGNELGLLVFDYRPEMAQKVIDGHNFLGIILKSFATLGDD